MRTRGLASRSAMTMRRSAEAVPTWSAHYIADPGFRRAVADFLRRERPAVAHEIAALDELAPFRKA